MRLIQSKKQGFNSILMKNLKMHIYLSSASKLYKAAVFILAICLPYPIFAFSSLEYKICFTPPNNCSSIIIDQINNAKSTIYIQAYGFTHEKIISALIEAKRRGVSVQIILDRSNFTPRYKENLKRFTEVGIPVFKDIVAGIAHNKVMIIDHYKVITGSFNFTLNADARNAENIIVLDNVLIAGEYYQNWVSRRKSEITK